MQKGLQLQTPLGRNPASRTAPTRGSWFVPVGVDGGLFDAGSGTPRPVGPHLGQLPKEDGWCASCARVQSESSCCLHFLVKEAPVRADPGSLAIVLVRGKGQLRIPPNPTVDGR